MLKIVVIPPACPAICGGPDFFGDAGEICQEMLRLTRQMELLKEECSDLNAYKAFSYYL